MNLFCGLTDDVCSLEERYQITYNCLERLNNKIKEAFPVEFYINQID
jgi:hypothetical protein